MTFIGGWNRLKAEANLLRPSERRIPRPSKNSIGGWRGGFSAVSTRGRQEFAVPARGALMWVGDLLAPLGYDSCRFFPFSKPDSPVIFPQQDP